MTQRIDIYWSFYYLFYFYFLLINIILNKKTIVANVTLMNTKLEVSMPGFMKIDYVNQIRKGEKIGGGGCAIIYKGVILDQKLREVNISFSFFFKLSNKIIIKKIK